MNKKQLLVIIGVLFCTAGILAAEDAKESPWSFSITTDFAWYPKSDYIASDSTHFAPITGPYSGLQA